MRVCFSGENRWRWGPRARSAEAAATLIDTVLESMPAETVVKVKAYGSQSNVDWTRADSPVINSLNITIEPIYGFVE